MINLSNIKNLRKGRYSLLPNFSVRQELTSSLLGMGPDITFGRATTHGVIDCYGAWHNVRSGEARFYGARRSQNLATNSEDFATGWTLGALNVLASITGVTSLRTGRESIKSVAKPSGQIGTNGMTLNSRAYRPGQHTFSVALATDTGTDTVKIRIERSSDSATVAELDAVAPQWDGTAGSMRVYSLSGTITDTTNHRVTFRNVTNVASILYLDGGQMEYTHNNGTGAPNEYTSIGVMSSPWYGANVDGVQYFDTLNGNTVTSGVVTYTPGAPLGDTNKGLLNEPGSANGVYSSRDIGAAQWTLTSATAASTMVDSGTLGYRSLRKLEEVAASANHRFQQLYRTTTPADNARISVSAYVKADERDIVYLGYIAKDGTEHIGYFNLTTLAVTLSSGANEEGYVYAVADGYRINMIGSALTGATAMQMIGGVTTTAGTTSYAGTLGSGAYFGGLQMEVEGQPTQYHADTTSAAIFTTNSDNAYYTIGTTLPANQWEIGLDATLTYNSNSTNKLNWAYLWYSNADTNNRFGAALRPGTYGGFNDAGADDWVFDLYPNSTSWDGVDITDNEENTIPLTTKRVVIQMHSSTKMGASNLAGKFGSTPAYNAAAATQAVNVTPTTATIRFGHNDSNVGSANITHSYCIKNYYVRSKPTLTILDAVPSIATILAGYLPTFINDYITGRYQRNSKSVAFPHGSVRTTNATMFDSEGRVVWAPANMILYSDDLTNAYWTKTDTTLSQDGTLAPSGAQAYLATEGTAGTAIIVRQIVVPATTPFNYAIEIKKGNHQFARVGLASGGEFCMAWVDFDAGTVSAALLGGTTTAPVEPSIEALADGFFRVTLTAIFPVTNPVVFVISAASSGSTSRVSNGTHYIGRINIELYDGTAMKLPNVVTAGSAYYGARLDYDPLTLTAKGILAETAITNSIDDTQNLTQLNGVISTGDTYLGNWVAKRYTGDGTFNAHLGFANAITVGIGEVRNVSAVVKMISGTRIQLATSMGHGAANVYVNFDLSTGTIVGTGAGATNAKITNLGNSLYRLSFTYTTTATSTGASVALYLITSDSDTRGPSNTSSDSYDVLLPLSAIGEFESSLIPTFGASATRGVDIPTLETSTWYKSNRGTVYAKFVQKDVDSSVTAHPIVYLTANGRWAYSAVGLIKAFDGTTIATSTAYTANTASQTATAINGSTVRLVNDNSAVSSIAFDSTMGTGTTLSIGNDGALALNGWIEEVRYYQDGAASDADLQALTV